MILRCALLCVVSVSGAYPPLPDANLKTSEYPVIAVIPDTHGDYEAAIHSIYLVYRDVTPETEAIGYDDFMQRFKNVVDHKQVVNPIPTTIKIALVQLGDLIHRGPYSRQCVDVFEAVPLLLGWHKLSLYGNHDIRELGNIPGYTRYIHQNDVRGSINLGTKHERIGLIEFAPGGEYFNKYMNSYLGIARWTGGGNQNGPTNPNTLFVHAGVEEEWWTVSSDLFPNSIRRFPSMVSDEAINAFNSELRENLTKSGAAKIIARDDSSFIQTRKIAKQKGKYCAEVEWALEYFDVARIVVGHTVQASHRLKQLCDGKFIIIDVAMSRWMSNPPQKIATPFALVLGTRTGGDHLQAITALSRNKQLTVFDATHVIPPPVDDEFEDLPELELPPIYDLDWSDDTEIVQLLLRGKGA